MKVVIDIPEIMYLAIKEYDLKPDPVTTDILYSKVKCGTLLDETNRPSFPPKKNRENSEIKNEIKDLSKRVETLEKQTKEDREERLKKQVVIDISEDVYTRLFDNGMQDNEITIGDVREMARAIRLGTPIKLKSEVTEE